MIIDNTKIFTLKSIINDIEKKIQNEYIDLINLLDIKGSEDSETIRQQKIIKYLETSKNIIRYVLGYSPIKKEK